MCCNTDKHLQRATNGACFVVKDLPEMLVSVVDVRSTSGALTGLGDSLSHSSSYLKRCQCQIPPHPLTGPHSPCSRFDVDSLPPLRTTGEIRLSVHNYQTNVAGAQCSVAAFDSCLPGAPKPLWLSAPRSRAAQLP